MKTVGVTDYLNQTHPFRKDTCVSLTLLKNEKIFIKCAQNRGGGGGTSSMCEQSLCITFNIKE